MHNFLGSDKIFILLAQNVYVAANKTVYVDEVEDMWILVIDIF